MNKIFVIFVLALATLPKVQAAQTCQTNISQTAPASEFTINGDGTVSHEETGLTWMQCSLGQAWDDSDCWGTASLYTWQEALQASEGEAFAGHSDWRLPNIRELRSIVEYACHSPAINLATFPATAETGAAVVAWSSSPYAGLSKNAWGVSFYAGGDGYDLKLEGFSVRLVRSE